MKKIFFKIGIALELVLVTGHLYVLRNGLPVPDIDPDSHLLIQLMKSYEIRLFGANHTIDQVLSGYDFSWAALVVFSFLSSLLVLGIPMSRRIGKNFTLFSTLLWMSCAVIAHYNWGIPQQILLGLLFIAFLLSYLFDWKTSPANPARVCVVGAGISGLTAAYQLQKQGYTNITVLEKEKHVGGKCLTHQVEWHPYDMGGHEMLAGYYDLIQIAKEVGAETRTSVKPLVYDLDKKKYLDFKNAATQGGNYSLLQVMWAALRYLYIVGIEFRNYAKPETGFRDMPAELAVDLEVWLAQRKLMPLASILGFVIKAQGFGGYGKSTAAYLVKFMGFKNWLSLLTANMGLTKKWPRVFVQGAQNFCERVAATLSDVRLGVTIRKIEREEKATNGIKVYLDSGEEPLLFDKLVISSPVSLSSLGFLNLGKEEPEYALFEKICTYEVYMSLCEIQGLPDGVVAWLPLTSEDLMKGKPTGYIKDFQDQAVAFFLAMVKDHKSMEEILKEIGEQLDRIPPYQGIQPKLVKKLFQQRWDYFPHLEDRAAMSSGFYNQLEQLQGRKQTYYANSAFSFECMGNCAGYSKRMVQQYF